MKAYNPQATVTVGTIRIPSSNSLRVAFTVSKNLKPEPNKARFDITNLTEEHIKQLQEEVNPPCQLDTGYNGDTETLFLGKLRTGDTLGRPDSVTTLESGDGEQEMRTGRVNVSIAAGTNTDQVLKQVALAVGVGKGNLDDAARKIRSTFSGTGNLFTMGTVLSGSAASELTRITTSLGLEWSIQNGKLQILERKKSLEGTAIYLSLKTGLLGEPTVDPKGVMSCISIYQKDVFPGRLIILDSFRVKGQYRIEETEHSGDTRGTEVWKIDIKGKRY